MMVFYVRLDVNIECFWRNVFVELEVAISPQKSAFIDILDIQAYPAYNND